MLLRHTARPELRGRRLLRASTQQAGDDPVYRFLYTGTNTHFYTSSPAEISAALAARPDLHLEGIAFFAPAA